MTNEWPPRSVQSSDICSAKYVSQKWSVGGLQEGGERASKRGKTGKLANQGLI